MYTFRNSEKKDLEGIREEIFLNLSLVKQTQVHQKLLQNNKSSMCGSKNRKLQGTSLWTKRTNYKILTRAKIQITEECEDCWEDKLRYYELRVYIYSRDEFELLKFFLQNWKLKRRMLTFRKNWWISWKRLARQSRALYFYKTMNAIQRKAWQF